MNIISAKEVNDNLQNFFIVDIREPYEYQACNNQSVNIPMAEFCDRINELPTDKTIVLMCKSGNRAQALGNMLTTEHILEGVFVMKSGIEAWIQEVDQSLILD